jgi:transcriptional regulator with GAF, ATPase, and Fis domain
MGSHDLIRGIRLAERRTSERRARGSAAPALEEGEPQELVQELRLQKIELELQQDELLLHKLELELQNEELQGFHQEMDASWKQIDQLVSERTGELRRLVKRLSTEVRLRNQAEAALRGTCAEMGRLRDRLQAENAFLHQEIDRHHTLGTLTGDSRAMAGLRSGIAAAAAEGTPVLLLGEPGTGREEVARAIHNQGARWHRALVAVDCTLLPAELLEGQLFGRDQGPSLGATGQWLGRLELADQGTLFLDEIGALPARVRSKLAQVFAEGQFRPLGGSRALRAGARIIAATALAKESDGAPQDLFGGQTVRILAVPALRERREDIPALVESFVAWFNRRHCRHILTIPDRVMEALAGRDWPGNVRELRAAVEAAVLRCPGPVLEL